jgi:hypothetical protein
MSILTTLFRRLAARVRSRCAATPDPDQLDLREWADLPAWHPRSDRAPC